MLIGPAQQARAQTYPEKPVRMVLPYPPGGGADVVGRPLAQRLSEKLGRQFIVDNRGGASGNIGMEIVAKSPPDGYTLVLCLGPQLSVNPTLYSKLTYDPFRDFAPIMLIGTASYFLSVHPTLPVRTIKEFIALARTKPGQIVYGSSGNGSGLHLSMELLKTMANVDALHVPYKGGGPALPDLLSGQLQAMFTSWGFAGSHIRAGRLRALAASTAKRSPAAPQMPTIAESGVPGYDSGVWYATLAPRGTPAAIVNRLHGEISALIKSTDLKERYTADGIDIIASTPDELTAYIKTDTARWAEVIKRANIKVE
ncbi:MAG: tripartite tricarboxylate transporter substrate binding protein [Betaproteobacteria bacterium]|nr:tripartite tricarboxylate transporter substrate binding protein [Betaproteobacteria bacterium]